SNCRVSPLPLSPEVGPPLREALQDCPAADRRVAIFGCGEAAEIAYLSLKEYGLEPVAIFDVDGGQEFLGMPVRAVAEHVDVNYDLMIVATLERSPEQLTVLMNGGVPHDKLFPLRRERLARRLAPESPKNGAGNHAYALTPGGRRPPRSSRQTRGPHPRGQQSPARAA